MLIFLPQALRHKYNPCAKYRKGGAALAAIFLWQPICANAAVYQIQASILNWLGPTLELCGIALQLLGALFWRQTPLWLGLALILPIAFWEQNIVLGAGDIVACAGLGICIWRKNSKP